MSTMSIVTVARRPGICHIKIKSPVVVPTVIILSDQKRPASPRVTILLYIVCHPENCTVVVLSTVWAHP